MDGQIITLNIKRVITDSTKMKFRDQREDCQNCSAYIGHRFKDTKSRLSDSSCLSRGLRKPSDDYPILSVIVMFTEQTWKLERLLDDTRRV